MAVMEAWTQTAFRYRDDDGSETGATWRQSANVNDTLSLDTTYRMRILITGAHTGGTGSFAFVGGFQYNVDAAGWNNITTTSTNVRAVASADTSWTITDDDATTEQMAGSATFVAGKMDETGTCGSVTISESEESEFELVFQLRSADLSGGESVQIRMVDSGSALSTYTQTPSITVDSAAPTTADIPVLSVTLTPQSPTTVETRAALVPALSLTLTPQTPSTLTDRVSDVPALSLTLTPQAVTTATKAIGPHSVMGPMGLPIAPYGDFTKTVGITTSSVPLLTLTQTPQAPTSLRTLIANIPTL